MPMTVEEYADLMHDARDLLFSKIREALPPATEMEKRFVQSGKVDINTWAASLVNEETKAVRIFVMLISNLTSADLAKTQGARNFNPEMKISFELFHDHLQDKNLDTQTEFEKDAFKIQFAIEANRALPPKGKIETYDFKLGMLPSSRSLHYGKGELSINFRDIRV